MAVRAAVVELTVNGLKYDPYMFLAKVDEAMELTYEPTSKALKSVVRI